MNPKVDAFIGKAKKWREELERLRAIVLDSPLTEEFKWWQPVYTYNNSNVIIISGYKEFCVLSFFKGALLKDENKILAKPGPNTRSARVIKFTDLREIIALEPVLKAYILEAVEVEKSGLQFNFKENREPVFPEELQKQLNENPELHAAFTGLTPGRQRAYMLYFSAPKQSKTRESRIEKYFQHILDGKGIND